MSTSTGEDVAEMMEKKEPSMPTLDDFKARIYEGGDPPELPPTSQQPQLQPQVQVQPQPQVQIQDKEKGEKAEGESRASQQAKNLMGLNLQKEEDHKMISGTKLELSAKQKEEIREAFIACDLDGSGYMYTSDLKIALRAMGFEPRKNEIKKIIEQVDKLNTGKLCFTDFLDVMSLKLAEKDSREEILKAFKLFDKDQSGGITFENLQIIAKELGEDLNDEELREMIEEADMNSDGSVDQDEFLRIMKKTSLY